MVNLHNRIIEEFTLKHIKCVTDLRLIKNYLKFIRINTFLFLEIFCKVAYLQNT